ncbi:hypothetical protein [Nocardiopsis dassonvillei]|uniref:hypothetical protein n=1 Tax=Nocardiopsis dassonvillei TaxID=2014 RepID=UPI00363512F0
MTTVEVERRHDELRPHVRTPVLLDTKPSRIPDRREVFGKIIVPRDYRVVGTFHRGQGHSPLNLPLLLRAGQPAEFHLGTVGYNEQLPVDEVRFQFWPPREVDDVDPWTCPCARSDTAEHPHWEAVARVEFDPIPRPVEAAVYPWGDQGDHWA